MAQNKHIVIGMGEVGRAVFKVLTDFCKNDVIGIDKDNQREVGICDVMHVCIPYSKDFAEIVTNYRKEYSPDLVIIHSTVPVGTSTALDAVHSPIRGVHPNLEQGIRTFPKYFGGERAGEAAEIFEMVGLRCIKTSDARNTEALKLWDTTYYGWNIAFMHEVRHYCDKNGLDFDLIYTEGNESYNEGYALLGREDVQRPVLKYMQGKIGGHCVIPNCHLLGGDVADFILKANDSLN